MNSMEQKARMIEKLRDLAGRMARINKDVATANVPGLELVREDLGIRHNKENKDRRQFMHGQVHTIPKYKKGVTAPSGTGATFTYNPVLGTAYAEWNPGEII